MSLLVITIGLELYGEIGCWDGILSRWEIDDCVVDECTSSMYTSIGVYPHYIRSIENLKVTVTA